METSEDLRRMWWKQGKTQSDSDQRPVLTDGSPIEPEERTWGGLRVLRWILLGMVFLYILFNTFRIPILTGLGRYLIVEHAPTRSDLMVCLSGGNPARGLKVAEIYRKGLSPRIFVAPEEKPDGFDQLVREGIEYPQSIDLLIMLLRKLGIPESAIYVGRRPVTSTLDEAKLVREFVIREKVRSLILVTSPTHSRRVFLIFRNVLEDQGVLLQMVPTPYSRFRPETWWESRKYVREVILEYQKLLFYFLVDQRR